MMASSGALALVWLLVVSLVAAHGDRSRLIRACLWIDETLRRKP